VPCPGEIGNEVLDALMIEDGRHTARTDPGVIDLEPCPAREHHCERPELGALLEPGQCRVELVCGHLALHEPDEPL
jgi:hypothetical protein